MALARVLEPELMDTDEEATDYDAMDHAEVNARFCADFLGVASGPIDRVLDVGTGTARIPIELCRRHPSCRVAAVDLAHAMLAVASRNVRDAGLSARVALDRRDAKATGWTDGAFDAVLSNSLVHHMPRPESLLAEMWRLVRTGGTLFVRDLARPASDAELRSLVTTHAPLPDPGHPLADACLRQRALFEASLRAALTVDEVATLVEPLGIPRLAVSRTSDRHWTLAHMKA